MWGGDFTRSGLIASQPSLHPEHEMIEYEHLEIKDIPLDNIPTQQLSPIDRNECSD